MSYFEDLTKGKIKQGGYILEHKNRLEIMRQILKYSDDPEVEEIREDLTTTLFYCYNLLESEYKKSEESFFEWKYIETESIDPRGNEFHVPKEFILLQDDNNIKGGTKLWAHSMLIMLNKYYRYLNKHSMEKNKYIDHRRSIYKLDPDIELPKTEDEVVQWFEDTVRKKDQRGYRSFLHSIGRKTGHRYTAYEKFIKDFNDPKHIKTRTE